VIDLLRILEKGVENYASFANVSLDC
jgi:hypothetical protein